MPSDLTANCVCEICKRNKKFRMRPNCWTLSGRNVVVFAGGGISSEDRVVLPTPFYESIADEIGLMQAHVVDFPNLMSRFCDQPNGRQRLLIRINQRLAYIKSFPELYNGANSVSSRVVDDVSDRKYHHNELG